MALGMGLAPLGIPGPALDLLGSGISSLKDPCRMPDPGRELADTPEDFPEDFGAEAAVYDQDAVVKIWEGPRYRMTYCVLGQGPPLIVIPGIAATYRVFALVLNRLAGHFRTVIYAYPGDLPDDNPLLQRITHEDLVAELVGLVDHLGRDRAYLFGPSFGSTIALRPLHRAAERFPAAVLQGGFARRRFSRGERLALVFGRRFLGRTLARIPLHDSVLMQRQKGEFPAALADCWDHFLRENGLTPMAALAHRLGLVSRLDLRPILPEIRAEVLLIQGARDRVIPRRHFEELRAGLPRASGVLLPDAGHLLHYSHAEELAGLISKFPGSRNDSVPASVPARPENHQIRADFQE
jgi:pimeloyl-ACP methyl ester carboxylesterase